MLSSALSLWFLQFVTFAAVLVFLLCSFHSLNSDNTAVSNGCTDSLPTNLSACSQTSSMKKLLTTTIFISYLVSLALPPVVFSDSLLLWYLGDMLLSPSLYISRWEGGPFLAPSSSCSVLWPLGAILLQTDFNPHWQFIHLPLISWVFFYPT